MTGVRHETGPDAGAVWHYGDPMREQRLLARGEATVDLSHRPVFGITGRSAHDRDLACEILLLPIRQ